MNSKKRPYTGLKMTITTSVCETPLLAGSKTSVNIDVDEVTVVDFADGFASDGGFKEISFD